MSMTTEKTGTADALAVATVTHVAEVSHSALYQWGTRPMEKDRTESVFSHGKPVTINSQRACDIAAEFLMDNLGEFVDPGTPQMTYEGLWIIPIDLSICPRGRLGQVGTIAVDAETGAVLFSDQDRAEVQARARALVAAAPH
jgi:hypothetical protein